MIFMIGWLIRLVVVVFGEVVVVLVKIIVGCVE